MKPPASFHEPLTEQAYREYFVIWHRTACQQFGLVGFPSIVLSHCIYHTNKPESMDCNPGWGQHGIHTSLPALKININFTLNLARTPRHENL